MNTVGKILVVFVTACSLGFLAFVTALRNGGPDWKGELRSEELQRDFVFSTEQGETTKYSAKHRRSETSVVDKTPNLAEVVVKSRKRQEDDAGKIFQELTQQLQPLPEYLAMMTKLIPEDQAGVEVCMKKIEERIEQLNKELQAVGGQYSTLTLQTQDVMRVAQERREEAYRLSNQLELLRNDSYSAGAQQKVLEGELIRLEENLRRLQRRQNQLKQQTGDDYDRSAAVEKPVQ
jgi:chromosome segregation ATPase